MRRALLVLAAAAALAGGVAVAIDRSAPTSDAADVDGVAGVAAAAASPSGAVPPSTATSASASDGESVPAVLPPTTEALTTATTVTTSATSTPTTMSPAVTSAPAGACPPTHHGAAVDRDRQIGWLCADGVPIDEFPVTGAVSQPDAGTYAVYAKDETSSSHTHGRRSSMTHFVAFTYGKYRGARIAFHSVPTYDDGTFVEPLESVGDPTWRGDSGGCFRVLPDDAARIWDHLAIGDEVRVLN